MKLTIALAIAMGLGGISASAMSFSATVDSITAHNPEVIKARLEAAAARADIKNAGALSDPEIGGEYMWMPKDVDNRWNVGIEWGFEWFGVYGARKNEARAQADAFTILAEATELSQRQAIISALTNWQLQVQKLRLIEKMADANRSLLELTQTQEKGGQISKLDANKVAIEVARYAVKIEDERQNLIEAGQTLSQLAGGLPILEWLKDLDDDAVFDEQLPSLETVVANAGKLPAVRAAVAGTESARRAVKVASAEGGPGLTFGYKHLFEDGMHFNGVSLGITLPIFSNRGKVEAAKARQLQAEFEAAAAERQEEATARALWQRAEALRNRIEPLRPVFDMTDNYALLKQQYENGEISLHEYQGDRLYFYDAEMEYLELQARYRNALADLAIYY